MFTRHLDQAVLAHFKKYQEVLILLGARQVGKTTLLQRLFPHSQYFLVDSEPIKHGLERYDQSAYGQLLKNDPPLIVVDEIQRLGDPGRAAKIIYDQMPQFKLIVTGSSAFNIKNKASESLAGRKIDYHLYPLTLSEYLVQSGLENKSFKLKKTFRGRSQLAVQKVVAARQIMAA